MNFVEQPKTRTLTPELEERAIEFHGHDGPFMTLGLRMGLTALTLLDCKGWFNLHCEVRLNWAPPDSCIIDGIQSSTGCTMGKRNISVTEQPGVQAVFTSKGKKLSINLREDVFDYIKNNMSEEDIPHEMIEELEEADLETLFEISWL